MPGTHFTTGWTDGPCLQASKAGLEPGCQSCALSTEPLVCHTTSE